MSICELDFYLDAYVRFLLFSMPLNLDVAVLRKHNFELFLFFQVLGEDKQFSGVFKKVLAPTVDRAHVARAGMLDDTARHKAAT